MPQKPSRGRGQKANQQCLDCVARGTQTEKLGIKQWIKLYYVYSDLPVAKLPGQSVAFCEVVRYGLFTGAPEIPLHGY